MLTLKKVFASAAALAVAGVGVTTLVSSSNAATPGACPLSGVVSAEAPTFTDRDGIANDTVTIPESQCINYTINGWDTPAGTYNLNNLTPYEKTSDSNDWLIATATVEAEAKADHWQLSGTYWWQQGFIGVYDPKNEVIQTAIGLAATVPATRIPVAPTFTDAQGLNEATVTIPQQDGVTYTIKGNKKSAVVAAGTYKVVDFANIGANNKARVTVTATSSDKKHIVISGTNTWTQEVYAVLTSGTSQPTTQPIVSGISRPIEDGVYVITSAMSSKKALDVNAGSTSSGANVQLWDRNNGRAQRFKVTYLGDSQYSIINEHSGKSLDIQNGSKKAGANVQQWGWSGSKNQRFTFVPASDGSYAIQVVSSGMNLDVYGSRTANGTNVIQWTNNDKANQRWNFNAVSSAPTTPASQPAATTPAPKPTTATSTPTPKPTPSQSASAKKVKLVAPTFDQKNNKYTIPNAEGVQYSVDGKNVAPGTYTVTGDGGNVDANGRMTISITAKPKAGYVSDSGYASYTWTATFAVRTVTPVAPTYKAGWSFLFINVQSEYTIPSVTGIDYYVNGSKVTAGTYTIPRGTSVAIEAKPQKGYSFPLNTVVINRWTFSSY